MNFFAESGIGPRFDGAVRIALHEFDVWFRHVFYGVRVNALIAAMSFLEINQRLIFFPCQYGNLHLTILDKSLLSTIKSMIKESQQLVLLEKRCGFERYNANGLIGRRAASI